MWLGGLTAVMIVTGRDGGSGWNGEVWVGEQNGWEDLVKNKLGDKNVPPCESQTQTEDRVLCDYYVIAM